MNWFDEYTVFRKHCVLNIALPEFTETGLQRPEQERDPRRWRIKPDAYVATVERVGSACEIIKPGYSVTAQRWQFLQLDIDSERICASEDHILTYRTPDGFESAMPGVCVGKILPLERESPIVMAEGIFSLKDECPLFHVEIIASNKEDVDLKNHDHWPEVGEHFLLKKWDGYQWKLGTDKLVFVPDNKFVLGNIEKSEIGKSEIEKSFVSSLVIPKLSVV